MVGPQSRWKSAFKFAFILALIFSVSNSEAALPSFDYDPKAHLQEIAPEPGTANEPVIWTNPSPDLFLQSGQDGEHLAINLEGCATRSHLSVVYGDQKLANYGKDGRCFSALAPLQGEKTELILKFVAPDGVTTQTMVQVDVLDPPGALMALKHRPNRLKITALVSGSLSSYTETSVTPITGYKIVPFLSAKFDVVRRKWSLQASGSIDGFVISPRPVDKWNRFLKVDVTGGYHFQREFWNTELELRAGTRTVQMWVSDSTFGFFNATALQLYPLLIHKLNRQNTLTLSLRYSPIMSGFGFLSPLESRSIDLGFQWENTKWSENYPFLLALLYENFQLKISNSTLNHQAIFVGAGMRWGGLPR